jgi:hypothetical protein
MVMHQYPRLKQNDEFVADTCGGYSSITAAAAPTASVGSFGHTSLLLLVQSLPHIC